MSYANALHDWRLMCGAGSSEGAAKRERGKAAMAIHVRTNDDWRRLARGAQSSRRFDPQAIFAVRSRAEKTSRPSCGEYARPSACCHVSYRLDDSRS